MKENKLLVWKYGHKTLMVSKESLIKIASKLVEMRKSKMAK